MSVLSSRPAMRWLVPAAVTAAVLGGGAAIGQFAAAAEPSLPERSAAQLLVDLQTARLDGLSGTVVQTADLGLPELPLGGQLGAAGASLISGSNTLRVWYSGPDKARLALLSSLGETDVIRNGRDVWLWQSRLNAGQHYRLSDDEARHSTPPRDLASQLSVTPQEAAEQALAAVQPSTEVTTGRNAEVAGRPVYELILTPRDKASLVGQIRLAIDAREKLPLRVEVYPTGSDEPAFKVAFTQVSFERPDAGRFTFNPPPGAKIAEETDRESESRAAEDKITERLKRAGEKAAEREKKGEEKAAEAGPTASTTVGEGWTTVHVSRGGGPSEVVGFFGGKMTKVSGAWGSGRLLTSKLFSVLVTDDGRTLAGAVAPERLYEVAATN